MATSPGFPSTTSWAPKATLATLAKTCRWACTQTKSISAPSVQATSKSCMIHKAQTEPGISSGWLLYLSRDANGLNSNLLQQHRTFERTNRPIFKLSNAATQEVIQWEG